MEIKQNICHSMEKCENDMKNKICKRAEGFKLPNLIQLKLNSAESILQ